MYKCHDCNLVFSEPKRYSEDRAPYGAELDPRFFETLIGCPSCGGSYEEAMECVRCNDTYIFSSLDHPFCAECTQEILSTYKQFMDETFREDEQDLIYDNLV